MSHARDYEPLIVAAHAWASLASRADRMQALCDLVWDAFGLQRPARPAYSWVGFYVADDAQGQMLLERRRDKPACSPIGLHGMCGRGYLTRSPIIINDVATLGTNYIACDPKDRSEVVVPMFTVAGACWGVLDADSYELAGFDERDVRGLMRLAATLQLTDIGHEGAVQHM